jgi:uncharacterized SAM-binding protein YcdF (DUF218 family)
MRPPASIQSTPAPPRRSFRVDGIAVGAACGLLIWIIADQLDLFELLPPLRNMSAWPALLLLAGGVWLWQSRARGVLLAVTAALMLLWLLVCLTPLSRRLLKSTVLAMPPRPAQAVVVLSSGLQPDGEWQSTSLARLLRGLEVVREGYAPVLVVTNVAGQRAQMRMATRVLAEHLRLPLRLEAVGPVRDTHDEALAVSRLARARGWKTVLLVTSPSHSRRAWLTFRKTGLNVISVPAQEIRYNFQNPLRPDDRREAFAAVLRELSGLQIYRLRGWI